MQPKGHGLFLSYEPHTTWSPFGIEWKGGTTMKKFLGLCMALVLCLSLLPVTALAVGEPATLYVGNK